MIITNIQQQIKDETRVNVFIDEKYVFSLSKIDISNYNINENEYISKEKYDEIIENVVFGKAKMTALRFLGNKDRTKKEVIRKLKEKGYNKEVTKRTLEFLLNYGYINDITYAKKYVNQRVNVKGYGKNKVIYELRQKGINDKIIDKVTEDIEEDEENTALKFATKKAKNLDLSNYSDRQKIFSYLQRRGFSYQIIKKTLLKIEETETDFDTISNEL